MTSAFSFSFTKICRVFRMVRRRFTVTLASASLRKNVCTVSSSYCCRLAGLSGTTMTVFSAICLAKSRLETRIRLNDSRKGRFWKKVVIFFGCSDSSVKILTPAVRENISRTSLMSVSRKRRVTGFVEKSIWASFSGSAAALAASDSGVNPAAISA